MNTPITESQVVAYLAERAKYLQRTTASPLASVTIDVSQHGKESGDHAKTTFRIYTHESGCILEHESLEQGITRMIALSAPFAIADAKRRQIETLLAEIAAIEKRGVEIPK